MSLFKKTKPTTETPSEVEKDSVKKSPKKTAPENKNLGETYRILKTPHISEKATLLTDDNKYVFKVYAQANKTEVKKAIQGLYKVKVENVNIINIHRKQRIFRGKKGFKPGYKKAIITLREGEKIEVTPR